MSASRWLAAAAILTCFGAAHAQVNIRFNPAASLNWAVVTSGTQSNVRGQSFQIINSENDFQMYWRAATGQAPQTAPRGINWMKEKVIAIHLGQRPSGGYSVVVQNIAKNGPVGTVFAVERTPAEGQWVSQQITSPYVIVRVDRSAAQLSLNLQKQEGGATGGVTIYGPGLFRYNPNNYDREGAGGWLDPKNQVKWEVFRSGTRSGLLQSGLFTIGNAFEWQRVWAGISGNANQTAPGGIDWSKSKLVVIALGERPTTGYGVEVVNVERNGMNGIIRAVEVIPVAGSRIRERRTAPYIVIQVPRELLQFNIDLRQREGNGDLRYNDG